MIVLFGATGDLAKRKLLPGMFHLAQVGLMPERFRIVGAARTPIAVEEFRELAREAVEASGRERPLDGAPGIAFAESLRFAGVGDGFERARRRRSPLPARNSASGAGVLFYLSLPPQAFGRDRRGDRRARARRGRPGDHREAVRHRPRVGPAS